VCHAACSRACCSWASCLKGQSRTAEGGSPLHCLTGRRRGRKCPVICRSHAGDATNRSPSPPPPVRFQAAAQRIPGPAGRASGAERPPDRSIKRRGRPSLPRTHIAKQGLSPQRQSEEAQACNGNALQETGRARYIEGRHEVWVGHEGHPNKHIREAVD